MNMPMCVVGCVCERESTSDSFSHSLEAEQVSLQARSSLQATPDLPAVQAHPGTNSCDSESGDWMGAEGSGAQDYHRHHDSLMMPHR